MKRSWTALAVALIALFAISGCNDYGNTFQSNTGAAITFLSPSNVSAGSSDFTLTVSGRGFVAKTFIEWNGKQLPTTVQTNTAGNVINVSAIVPAALVAKAGNATVITQNPFSGAGNNGLSNPLIFIINPPPNPVPTLTSIAPATIAACGTTCANASFTLDLVGTNFLTSPDPTQVSQVRWTSGATQTTLTTTSVTATDIKATVPGSLYSAAGTAAVTVYNPPSPQTGTTGGTPNPSAGGGGASASQTFTITAAAPIGAHATVPAAASVAEETPAISADGRYVAFTAAVADASSQTEHTQIFVSDTCENADAGCKPHTAQLSVAADGSSANDDASSPSMSANGRYVAFSSAATNLVDRAQPGHQIYLRDTCSAAQSACSPSTQIISTDSSGALTGAENILPSVSASGRFVAFLSVTASHAGQAAASGGKNSGYRQVFVRDTCLGATSCTPKTTRVSLQPNDGSGSAKLAGPSIGANGKSLALSAESPTLFTRSVAIEDRVFLAITNPDK